MKLKYLNYGLFSLSAAYAQAQSPVPDDTITSGFEPRKANRGASNPSVPLGACQVNPGSKKNRYSLSDNCSDPTTSGSSGHQCTVTCAKNTQAYYKSADGTSFVSVVDNEGNEALEFTLNCVEGADGLGWDADYDFESLRCMMKKHAGNAPSPRPQREEVEENVEENEPADEIIEEPVVVEEEVAEEEDVVEEVAEEEVEAAEETELEEVEAENPEPIIAQHSDYPDFDLSLLTQPSDMVRGKVSYEEAPPGLNVDGVVCPMNKKEPKDGKLICPNTTPGSRGNTNAAANDLCSVHCTKGYKSTTYTQIRCIPVRSLKDGALFGVWSEKKAAICQPKSDFTTDAPVTNPATNAPTRAPTPTQAPNNNPNNGKNPNRGKIGAYFPSSWTENMIPAGYYNLNAVFATESSDNSLTSLQSVSKWTGHRQILPAKQCVVCSNARTMKKCIQQNETCNLRRGEICAMEIKKDGHGVLIKRSCMARRSCLENYWSNIRFGGNQSLLSDNGKRPRQQCRYISEQLAVGNTQISSTFVKAEKTCNSCHRMALSVPFL